MKFFIYHHNDFDGVATAGMFSKFLSLVRKYDFDSFKFIKIDYDIKDSWTSYKLKSPNAVLDFLYHHKADWWFDHHATAFTTKATEHKPYIRDNKKYWNTNFDSCPSLLLSHIYKYYRSLYNYFKTNYSELIHWSDIIDGAKYSSPKELYNHRNIYININSTLALDNSEEYLKIIIESIYYNDLKLLQNNKHYKQLTKKAISKENEAIKVVKGLIRIENRIAFFDQSNYDIPFLRFLAYSLYPDLLYRIAVYKKNDNFSVSVNYNIWSGIRNQVHLGNICKELGGGGRMDVGAIITETHYEAIEKAGLIIKKLTELTT